MLIKCQQLNGSAHNHTGPDGLSSTLTRVGTAAKILAICLTTLLSSGCRNVSSPAKKLENSRLLPGTVFDAPLALKMLMDDPGLAEVELMYFSDPIKALDSALARNDRRFIIVPESPPEIPGLNPEQYEFARKVGIREVNGVGDSMTYYGEVDLVFSAFEYAKVYNTLLMWKLRHDPKLQPPYQPPPSSQPVER